MKINNDIISNKTIIGFAFLYLLTVALLILFFTLSSNSKTSHKIEANTSSREVHNKLADESKLLLDHLRHLEKLDKRYSALFVQSEVTPAMDSVDTDIAQQEYIVGNILDSFDREKSIVSIENKTFADQIDSFFKQSLESRRTIGGIRYALAAGNFDLDSGQKKWLKLNSDLIAKDDRILVLENMLTSNNASSGKADISVENQKLKVVLNEQEKKNIDLVNSNNLLKQNLKTLNISYSKLNGTGKEKSERNYSKELPGNTNDELNAEIQLARISCNLARADEKQIISNSKQRKELLSEALNVLNTLAKSNDPVIQNKAKEKLNELYKISENIRD